MDSDNAIENIIIYHNISIFESLRVNVPENQNQENLKKIDFILTKHVSTFKGIIVACRLGPFGHLASITFARRIWLFYKVTFIPETSNVSRDALLTN